MTQCGPERLRPQIFIKIEERYRLSFPIELELWDYEDLRTKPTWKGTELRDGKRPDLREFDPLD